MTHGGNVWQGEGPKHWLDYSANLRPEGAPEWVKSALLRAVDSAAYYPDPEMKRARRAMAQASRALVMLLPTPPLPKTTPMTFFTLLLGLGASCSGAAVREEHAAPQVEQSWVHSSLIL